MTRPKDDHKTPDDEVFAPRSGQIEDSHASEANATRRAVDAHDDATSGSGRDDVEPAAPVAPEDRPDMDEGDGEPRASWSERDAQSVAARDEVFEESATAPPTHRDDATSWSGTDSAAGGAGLASAAVPRGDTASRIPVEDEEDHDEHGLGVAGRLLVALLIAIVAAIGALYAAPKLAPHVPEGVAKYLVPGQRNAEARIAELEEALAAANERLAALETSVASGETVDGIASAVTAVEERVSALESQRAELEAKIDDVASAPAATGEPGAAAIADLEARLDQLSTAAADPEAVAAVRSELAALLDRVSQLSSRLDQMEEARAGEIARLEQTVRASALERAVAALVDRAGNGGAFAEELAEVEQVSGAQAPEALTAAAAASTPSSAELLRRMSEPAQAALAADVRAGAGDGALGEIGAWFRSQIVARPTTAREGDGVGAILSRVAANLEQRDAAAALAEAEALPAHAQEAMAGWLDRLRARATLDSALAEWVASLGVNG